MIILITYLVTIYFTIFSTAYYIAGLWWHETPNDDTKVLILSILCSEDKFLRFVMIFYILGTMFFPMSKQF